MRTCDTTSGGVAPPPALIEGHVTVTLEIADRRVARTSVSAIRSPGAVAAMTGLPVPDAVRLVGLLFSLCGTAQTVAALGAAEAALGRPAPASAAHVRHALVLAEALDQSALRIGLDWAKQIGASPNATGLRALRRDLTALRAAIAAAHPGWNRIAGEAAEGAAEPTTLGPGAATTLRAIRRRIHGWTATRDAGLTAVGDVHAWAAEGETVAARAVALALEGPPDPAPPPVVPPVAPLTDWTLEDLAVRLRDDPTAEAFQARPDWCGQPAETGAMARFHGHPVVRDLMTQGRGLAARLVARLLDLQRLETDLDAVVQGGTAPPMPTYTDGPGVGLAAVDTARGLLVHRMRVADGRIAGWRIVAPTDWNTHPNGVLALAPLGWSARNRGSLKRRADLLALAVDPCVAHDVRIVDETAGLGVEAPVRHEAAHA